MATDREYDAPGAEKNVYEENGKDGYGNGKEHTTTYGDGTTEDVEVGVVNKTDPLSRDLQGRHMQMIAIGRFFVTQCLPTVQVDQVY
jgi:amino acid permease